MSEHIPGAYMNALINIQKSVDLALHQLRHDLDVHKKQLTEHDQRSLEDIRVKLTRLMGDVYFRHHLPD